MKTEPDCVRCQTASVVGRAIPPAPAALLVHSSSRQKLEIREGEVRRGKDKEKHSRGRSKKMVKKRNGVEKNPVHEFYVALRFCKDNIVKKS